MSDYILDKDYFVRVIKDLIPWAEERKDYFTELDSAIGDGDHGIGMKTAWHKLVLPHCTRP